MKITLAIIRISFIEIDPIYLSKENKERMKLMLSIFKVFGAIRLVAPSKLLELLFLLLLLENIHVKLTKKMYEVVLERCMLWVVLVKSSL